MRASRAGITAAVTASAHAPSPLTGANRGLQRRGVRLDG